MADLQKPGSPFRPGQRASVEVFVGRAAESERIVQRGARQTSLGKPTMFFVRGEYGIGKSSLANYCLQVAEQEHGLMGITASLAGQTTLVGVAESILQALVTSAARDKGRWEILKEKFARYVKSASLFGFEINPAALRDESVNYADVTNFLGVLGSTLERLMANKEKAIKGIFLVLDEINGVASEPMFAHFLKGVVDRNALAPRPLPLCLVLCGTPDRWRDLVEAHEPVGRIFDVVEVAPLADVEARAFFARTFGSVGMTVEAQALESLVKFGSGQPRILHMLGDAAYWRDTDGLIDGKDAMNALSDTARDYTLRFVGPRILDELRSTDYRAILRQICQLDPLAPSFTKAELAQGLREAQRRKLDNFLQRLQQLRVLHKGRNRGEWVFNTPMVRTAIFLLDAASD